MATVQELTALGHEIGFTGLDLKEFIKEQQNFQQQKDYDYDYEIMECRNDNNYRVQLNARLELLHANNVKKL